jgi:hypothetical protein
VPYVEAADQFVRLLDGFLPPGLADPAPPRP